MRRLILAAAVRLSAQSLGMQALARASVPPRVSQAD